jgi:hypothetical protein
MPLDAESAFEYGYVECDAFARDIVFKLAATYGRDDESNSNQLGSSNVHWRVSSWNGASALRRISSQGFPFPLAGDVRMRQARTEVTRKRRGQQLSAPLNR